MCPLTCFSYCFDWDTSSDITYNCSFFIVTLLNHSKTKLGVNKRSNKSIKKMCLLIFSDWNDLKVRVRAKVQRSQPWRGPWRQQRVQMPPERRPLCSDIRSEESEECWAPGRSPPRLMVFQGPQRWLNVEQRRSPHIFMSPFFAFCPGMS